jgi:hypothetical protein
MRHTFAILIYLERSRCIWFIACLADAAKPINEMRALQCRPFSLHKSCIGDNVST